MKREDMELILQQQDYRAEVYRKTPGCEDLAKRETTIAKLARLGASIAAPTSEELVTALRAMVEADDKQTGYQRCEHMLRAAILALKDPADV